MNHLCCRICSQVFRKPVTVPCGHNFCARCVQRLWDQDQTRNQTKTRNQPFRCPVCDRTFSRPQFIINTTLAKAVRESRNGRKRKVPTSDESENTMCETHKQPLDVYCCTDEQVICAQCTPQHIGHTIGWMTEERRRRQEELKNMQTEVTQILQRQEESWKSLNHMFHQIEEEAKQAEAYCQSIIVEVIDALQNHYHTVKELIAAQEEEAVAQVQLSVQALKRRMEEMKRRDAELHCLAQTENNVCFMQKWHCVAPLSETDLEDSQGPVLPFELTKRVVEKLGRQLEDFCQKEFPLISQTVAADSGEQQESEGDNDDMLQTHLFRTSPSCAVTPYDAVVLPHESEEEPVTREQFLQYACELSLDPTTAHEDLVISDDGKEVRQGHLKYKNPLIPSPQRFVCRRQVLCREGLQAERCYYEVEVKGDKSEIALTYKGINRKSLSKKSAFGGNSDSWSLDCSTYYSVSHRGDSIQLSTLPSHHRIGVYLQFIKGTLSFYEVSDTMKILYKMEAKFTEPLYPGFWLGDKCCIRICDLTSEREIVDRSFH